MLAEFSSSCLASDLQFDRKLGKCSNQFSVDFVGEEDAKMVQRSALYYSGKRIGVA